MCTIANGPTMMANRVEEPMIPIALCRSSSNRIRDAKPSVVAIKHRLIVRRKSGENGFSRINRSNRDRFDCRPVCCCVSSNGSRRSFCVRSRRKGVHGCDQPGV